VYVCVEVSVKTGALMLNFYQWCKTPSSAFGKKNSATTPKKGVPFGANKSLPINNLRWLNIKFEKLAPEIYSIHSSNMEKIAELFGEITRFVNRYIGLHLSVVMSVFVSEMTYNALMERLNSSHSLINVPVSVCMYNCKQYDNFF